MTHPTDDSLKPCPFCGSQPEPAPYVLKCVNAYCEAQPSVSGGNDDECATAWNKRALLVEQARTEPHKAEDAPSDAAAVDVAGLMAMVKKATAAHYLLGLASGEWRCTPEHHADKDAADAALESALRLALAAREWQPIETAPQDGSTIWVLDELYGKPWQYGCIWNGIEWYHGFGDAWPSAKPTGWMPLPAAAPKGTT